MRRRWVVAIGVVAAVAVLAVAAVVVLGGKDAASAEVRLEPIGASFESDFAGNLDVLAPGASIALALEGVPPVEGSVAGDEPGLYGGSRSIGTCDLDQLVDFLLDPANAAKARAWTSVLGIDVDDIATFVASLTAVRLRFDTAVTNHGFVDGEANPISAVLEAGTAVLVDDLGVPRVKCNCGNPLAPPGFETADVRASRSAWDRFDPEAVVRSRPAGTKVRRFVLVDVDDGSLFTRPVGTNGERDAPAPAEASLCAKFGDSPTCTGRGLTPDVTMPNLAGSTIEAATAALELLGFVRPPIVEVEPSEDVPAGVVVGSEPPAGREVPVKSPVTLVVSSGPDGGTSTTTSTTGTTGTTVATSSTSTSSTTSPPTTSSSTTTTTRPVVVVPDVVGMTRSQAELRLQQAGLVAEARSDFNAPPNTPNGTVTNQDPQAGTTVPAGSTVTIFVADTIG